MADSRLLSYILRRYQEGHSLSHIKNRLVSKGWGSEEIHEAVGMALLMSEDPDGTAIVYVDEDTSQTDIESDSLSLDKINAHKQEATDYNINRVTSDIELEESIEATLPDLSRPVLATGLAVASLEIEEPTLLVEVPPHLPPSQKTPPSTPLEKVELQPLGKPIRNQVRHKRSKTNPKLLYREADDAPAPIPEMRVEHGRFILILILCLVILAALTYSVLNGGSSFLISWLPPS